jgi:hypothetical protein
VYVGHGYPTLLLLHGAGIRSTKEVTKTGTYFLVCLTDDVLQIPSMLQTSTSIFNEEKSVKMTPGSYSFICYGVPKYPFFLNLVCFFPFQQREAEIQHARLEFLHAGLPAIAHRGFLMFFNQRMEDDDDAVALLALDGTAAAAP